MISKWRFISMWIIAAVIIAGFGMCEVAKAGSPVSIIDGMIQQGQIMRVQYAKYWIHPIVWASLTAEHKEKVAAFCAEHYKHYGGGAFRSEIYDGYSGKKLAKYGAFGCTIY